MGLASILASQLAYPIHASNTSLNANLDTGLEESWSLSLLEYLLDKRASFDNKDDTFLNASGLISEEELALGKAETSRLLLEHYNALRASLIEEDSDAVYDLAFLKESLECVEKITVPNINEVFCMMQPCDTYHVANAGKEHQRMLNAGGIINLNELIPVEISNELIAIAEQNKAAMEAAYVSDGENYFAGLPVQEWEVRIIKKIVNTLGEKNEIQLLFKKKELKKLGNKIYHVHPLKFLEAVFTDEKTAHSMREVEKNHFKWDGFMDGFSEKIDKELSSGNLLQYLSGFAATLSLDPKKLHEYAVNRDWKKFVRYLIHRS